MTKIWIAVNGILLLGAGLLVWQLYSDVEQFEKDNDLKKLGSPTPLPTKPVLPAASRPRYDPSDYGVIPEQNLFSATRSAPGAETSNKTQSTPSLALNPRPALVGVTLSSTERLALVRQSSAAGGQKAQADAQVRRVGDVIQGFKITEITERHMVLEYGAQREIIPLYDQTRQATSSGKTPILATRVVTFGGAGASGKKPAGASAKPAASPVRTTSTAVRSAQQSRQQTSRASGSTTRGQPAPATRTAASPGASPPATTSSNSPTGSTWNSRVDAQGRRIIRTPFGDIVREAPKVKENQR